MRDARTWAKDRDVQLYFVAFPLEKDMSSLVALQSQAFMDELAELTGGKTYFVNSPDGLRTALQYIAEDLRSQFIAEISPNSLTSKSEWMKISIKANNRKSADKETFVVRTRTGVKF